jgi:gelsolin
LNSGDAFLLVAPGAKQIYLWAGLGANEPELALGKKLMEKFGGAADVKMEVKEGEEPEEFWNAIGGKGEYSSVKD